MKARLACVAILAVASVPVAVAMAPAATANEVICVKQTLDPPFFEPPPIIPEVCVPKPI